jgi:hypothetical protein
VDEVGVSEVGGVAVEVLEQFDAVAAEARSLEWNDVAAGIGVSVAVGGHEG